MPLERDLKGRSADASVMLYACGPEPMLAAVAKLASTYGRPSQVSVERVMGCGVGGGTFALENRPDRRGTRATLRLPLA